MKRDLKKMAVSLPALLMLIVLTVGSTGIDLIGQTKGKLISRLRDAKSDSDKTVRSVYAYSLKLKNFLKQNDLRDSHIKLLERRLKDMKIRYKRLSRTIHVSQSDAEALFDILSPLAEDIHNEKWKAELRLGVETHKICFQKEMAKTGSLMRRLNRWIQQFDDIVGYCQITRKVDDDVIEDISRTIENEKDLNSEIKECIDTGLEIIEKISYRNVSCGNVSGCS